MFVAIDKKSHVVAVIGHGKPDYSDEKWYETFRKIDAYSMYQHNLKEVVPWK